MIYLTALTPQEICEHLEIEKKYRGRQIFKWIQKGIFDVSLMKNLPKQIKEKIGPESKICSSKIDLVKNDNDGTSKIRIILDDGLKIESVLLKDNQDRKTACISTQVGCAMGCTFCKTATMGLKRNLNPNEIVEQFLLLENKYGSISNIVFMGMGEPLNNISNLRKAIEILRHEEGKNIGHRRITVSTCGIADGIDDLTYNGPNIRLAVSLVSANSEIRETLMPVTKKYPLSDLRNSLVNFQRKYKKRITLEWVLMKNQNSSNDDIKKLKQFIKGLEILINVIPWNPIEGLTYEEPSQREIRSFMEKLIKEGIPASQRYRRGKGINGACGQLTAD